VLARVKLTRIAKLALAAGVLASAGVALAGLPELALCLGSLTVAGAICLGAEMLRSGQIAYRAVEECATELNLTPLGKLIRQSSPAEVAAAASKPTRAQLASQERAAD
jgi:hypothetical protein